MTATLIFSSAAVALTDGQQVTVPPTGGVTVPADTLFNSIQLIIGLPTADKLAVGKSLILASRFSFDSGATWKFINGFTWHSYGPGGYTVRDPDGTVHVNPDPALYVPLNGLKGLLLDLQYTAQGLSTASVTINGIS